ncbi:Outer membrane protein transport protein (OMPP1/FadL/TodX) [Posidoniimonas corsicana]|uniref:Outer membrane protein transport protein (OMPP1/FadL/TodX) n=1 Tax=Posidoniimonas corsicana TaxID=1938618 RepID=A0A5C5V200_9BACT|nr:outer membrane protein transport protein [Posidoniimonas corsicana]TWT32431.1 Outer membrane protein transport protein (OMPP1/FadL/TodX) [Posidoniimonas corsicana]
MRKTFCLCTALAWACFAQSASAQSFGVELHGTVTPAAGGMGGVSIAQPQDVQSTLTGNPATLSRFRGTQFSVGAGWVEPTINLDNDATLPLAGVSPFDAKSSQPGSSLVNIAVSQDFTAFDLPATVGLGLLTGAGLGVNYLDASGSNGSAASLLVLNVPLGVGVQVTDRLAAGAQMAVSTSVLDGPFSGLGAATTAYGLRGNLGLTYNATDCTTLGFYWMTKQSFRYEDAVRLSLGGGAFSTVQDVQLDLPETFGWGVSNNRLMDGRLLLASDILYKRYSECDFFRAIWDDQFVFQSGVQYSVRPNLKLRLGYAYAENNMRDAAAAAVGGVIPPDGLPAVQFIQAQFPSINPHRISGGVGVRDLLPGVDLDLNAGGMFRAADTFGLSSADAESYWIALGMTWRFERGSCRRLPAPDRW